MTQYEYRFIYDPADRAQRVIVTLLAPGLTHAEWRLDQYLRHHVLPLAASDFRLLDITKLDPHE